MDSLEELLNSLKAGCMLCGEPGTEPGSMNLLMNGKAVHKACAAVVAQRASSGCYLCLDEIRDDQAVIVYDRRVYHSPWGACVAR